MKIEYDPTFDLLYVWFAPPGTRAAHTETIEAGVNADFDRDGHLVGLEVLDAQQILGPEASVEFSLSSATA